MFFCQDLVAIHVNEDDLPAVAICDRFLLETLVNGKTNAVEKNLPDNNIIFVRSDRYNRAWGFVPHFCLRWGSLSVMDG